ncbi:MAG TPA: hypothetical protein DCQ92_09885 [Verrucomicrobia subdivision 3 bacterium]|nr:hypothetical protein [Limisphaerales bacterium]
MKTKLLTILCAGLIGFGGISNSRATEDNSLQIVGDLALARPGCLAATIIGTAVFIVALPFAAASGSVRETADTLVVHPAQATFTRPLGDFSTLH